MLPEQDLLAIEKACVTPDLNYNELRRIVRDSFPKLLAEIRSRQELNAALETVAEVHSIARIEAKAKILAEIVLDQAEVIKSLESKQNVIEAFIARSKDGE